MNTQHLMHTCNIHHVCTMFGLLPFMYAITTKFDVVSCISPLFFFERWQMLFTFIEVYRHFGVTRQSIYISSILTNIMQILQKYEKYGYIELVPWTMLIKEDRDNEIDPNSEMSWRNQETAMNECLFKYKVKISFMHRINLLFYSFSFLIFN
uniref:Glycosyltransferase family 92 protein n=1 Tax=Ascaris lumbricoides TaxID=6252 RepID=A0A0M3HIE8_ASCLU